jgi:hypothetical protein
VYLFIKYNVIGMKKTEYQNNLRDIRRMSNMIRKGLNESCLFEDGYDDLEAMETEQPVEEPTPEEQPVPSSEVDAAPEQTQEPVETTGQEAQADVKDVKPEDQGMEELDKMGELDQIRKITLTGMTKLSSNPEHPEFQALLKIFQLCNKAVKPEENSQNA